MTKNQADQAVRIIHAVFQYEESIDPRTVALVFEYIGRIKGYTDKEETGYDED